MATMLRRSTLLVGWPTNSRLPERAFATSTADQWRARPSSNRLLGERRHHPLFQSEVSVIKTPTINALRMPEGKIAVSLASFSSLAVPVCLRLPDCAVSRETLSDLGVIP